MDINLTKPSKKRIRQTEDPVQSSNDDVQVLASSDPEPAAKTAKFGGFDMDDFDRTILSLPEVEKRNAESLEDHYEMFPAAFDWEDEDQDDENDEPGDSDCEDDEINKTPISERISGSIYKDTTWFFKRRVIERNLRVACIYRDIYYFNPEIVTPHVMENLYALTCESCGANYASEEATRHADRRNPVFTLCCSRIKQGENSSSIEHYSHFRTVLGCPLKARLSRLLSYEDPLSSAFLKDIRKFNTTLSFASPVVKEHFIDNKMHRGPPTIIAHGNIVHLLGPVFDNAGNDPQYMQAYFYEPLDASQPMPYYFDFDNSMRSLLEELRSLIKNQNDFYKTLRTVVEEYKRQPEGEAVASRTIIYDESSALKLLDQQTEPHQVRRVANRTYNAPSTEEVAMLTDYDPDITQYNRMKGIVIYPKGSALKHIKCFNAFYFPLSYPLFYLYGEEGWHPNIFERGKKISLMAYASRLCQIRDPKVGPVKRDVVLSSGKLFQQFACDLFACIESDRLEYIRQHQKELRADSYSAIQRAIQEGGGTHQGKFFVLPSTHIGSMRWYNEQYLDAMARVTKFGTPDLFITMTCNPKWPEITESLRQSQLLNKVSAVDRPDVVARVFNVKMKALLNDITKERIFGDAIGFQAVVEYQKRGLPHCHILIWLATRYKPKTVDHYDRIVAAEIPDPRTHGELYELVKTHMLHTPCSKQYTTRKCPCIVNGYCKAGFPKRFCKVTTQREGTYPELRRRSPDEGGHTCDFSRNEDTLRITNRWVVPYNAYLLLRYKCHINVEIVNTLTVVKYLYKYIYKGTSKAVIAQRRECLRDGKLVMDEIESYISLRYFGPVEAIWRIFGFSVSDYYPPVRRLKLHLPNQQHVTYGENQEIEALRMADDYGSMLLAFFEAVRKESEAPPVNEAEAADVPLASQLTYIDFPMYFTFNTGNKSKGIKCSWKRVGTSNTRLTLKKGNTIGRLYYVPPTQGELFFLRILLCQVKGPHGYEDLRTVNNTIYGTFKEACIARGLFHDDDEWKNCLTEAILVKPVVSAIRVLFVVIIFYNEPENPRHLWEEFKNGLSDDFRHRRKSSSYDQSDYDSALLHINRLLGSFSGGSKSLSDYNLPEPVELAVTSSHTDVVVFDPVEEEITLQANISKMNADQSRVFELIKQRLESIDIVGSNLFIDAPGGTGKTFLLNNIIRFAMLKGVSFIASAYSGIAANLLKDGKTVHTWFKLPLHCMPPVQSSLGYNTQQGRVVRDTKLIIIDEAPMLHTHQLDAIHNLLNALDNRGPQQPNPPFSNKLVILAGDFRQTLPVIPTERRAGVIAALITRSRLWSTFSKLTLTRNERVLSLALNVPEDRRRKIMDYADLVLGIGNGTVGSTFTIPSEYVFPPSKSINDFLHWIYPEFGGNAAVVSSTSSKLHERAILCTTNRDADEINGLAIDLFESEISYTLKSADSNDVGEFGELQDTLTTEVLNSLNYPGMPPHELKLKPGAPMILLRNLNISDGLCNGTKLEFIDCQNYLMRARILGGRLDGTVVLIPRIKFITDHSKNCVPFVRVQFPVKLAFAMTINKSQGQTLQTVGVYLPSPVFSHGQLYVAFSRCANPSQIKVYIPMKDNTNDSHRVLSDGSAVTINEVWPECFQ